MSVATPAQGSSMPYGLLSALDVFALSRGLRLASEILASRQPWWAA